MWGHYRNSESMNVYGEINQQRRAMGRRRDHVDRRQLAKYRGAFDRRGDRARERCHLRCTSCGALVPPVAHDPRRADAAHDEPCPHCGSRAWVDLTENEVTRSLAEVEAYEHGTIDRGRRIGHWLLRIGGAISLGTMCLLAAANSPSGIFAFLTLMVGLTAFTFFSLGFGHATKVEQRSLPYRWALPLPPSAEVADDAARLRGPVSMAADDEPLIAPLSGRPCVAYRVVVRREGAPGNAVPALVTQESRDLTVEGRTVLASNVRLDLDTQPFTVGDEQQATALAYLRRHGITEADGPWVLEEGRLETDTPVLVEEAERHGAILRVA